MASRASATYFTVIYIVLVMRDFKMEEGPAGFWPVLFILQYFFHSYLLRFKA